MLSLIGIRSFLAPIFGVLLSFVQTPIGAAITAGVASHYVTKWAVKAEMRKECDARAAESKRIAFEIDTQTQAELLTRQYNDGEEIKRLRQEAAKKDKEYEASLANAQKGSRCSRRATDADDRRVFPQR